MGESGRIGALWKRLPEGRVHKDVDATTQPQTLRLLSTKSGRMSRGWVDRTAGVVASLSACLHAKGPKMGERYDGEMSSLRFLWPGTRRGAFPLIRWEVCANIV